MKLKEPLLVGQGGLFGTLRESLSGVFSVNLKKEQRVEADLKPTLEKLLLRKDLSLEEVRLQVIKALFSSNAILFSQEIPFRSFLVKSTQTLIKLPHFLHC